MFWEVKAAVSLQLWSIKKNIPVWNGISVKDRRVADSVLATALKGLTLKVTEHREKYATTINKAESSWLNEAQFRCGVLGLDDGDNPTPLQAVVLEICSSTQA